MKIVIPALTRLLTVEHKIITTTLMSSREVEEPEADEVAGFIAKTYQILSNDEFAKIIYWAPSGLEFVIKDIPKFQQVVLPRYFRHNKMNSFIRQLNMYGFHKSRADHTKSVFSHPDFMRDREDLLITVKRKIKGKMAEEHIETPVKHVAKSEARPSAAKELADTGNELTTRKQFSIAEPNNTSFNYLNLIESKQRMPSKMNLNFSIQRLSLNDLPQMFNLKEEIEDDCVSIEDKIEGVQRVEEKGDRRSERLSMKHLMNPSCFFTSIRK